MGKKKGKKQDADKKAALQAKKDAKQDKAALKRLSKQQRAQSGGDDGDEDILASVPQGAGIDELLAAYKRHDERKETTNPDSNAPCLEPIETPFPLARANATLEFAGDSTNKKDYFFLFGGEYYDGVENIVLDDMLRFEPDKMEWKRIWTPPSLPKPSPRCAHSCVSYKESLYIFGGELASADQYHHYRDLWKFDTKTHQWTEIAAKNPPSARSGHSTIVWKSYMILFGGFFEALRETKWYNDVHVFNMQTETWLDLPQSRLAIRPEPRSSSNAALFGSDKLIIHGGFAKLGSGTPGPTPTAETKVHTDAWILNLAPILKQQAPTWERWMSSNKTISSMTPNSRAGTASVSYKNRMLVFGGVIDSEQHHHKVDSVFYNDLIALDTERRKWFVLRVKQKKNAGSRRRRKTKDEIDDGESQNAEEDQKDEENEINNDESSVSDFEEDEDEETEAGKTGWDIDMLRANMFAFVDGNGNVVYEKIDEDDDDIDKKDTKGAKKTGLSVPIEESDEEKEEEEEDTDSEEEKEEEKEEEEEDAGGKEEKEGSNVSIPSNSFSQAAKKDPRLITASSVMVVNPETKTPEAVERTEPLPRINTSMLLRGHNLYILGGILEVGDREVTLDDMWRLDLRKRENWECLWPGTMHKQVWRGAIHDDDDSYISTGRESDSDDEEDGSEEEAEGSKLAKSSKRSGLRQEIAMLNEKYNLQDASCTPGVGEALADFYSRTSDHWNTKAAEQFVGTDGELSNKDMKREGFKLARERYEELSPIMEKMSQLEVSQKQRKEERSDRKDKKEKKSKKSSRR